jgi:hypothetical protein
VPVGRATGDISSSCNFSFETLPVACLDTSFGFCASVTS